MATQEPPGNNPRMTLRGAARWVMVVALAVIGLHLSASADPVPTPKGSATATPTGKPSIGPARAPGKPAGAPAKPAAAPTGTIGGGAAPATDYNVHVTAQTLRYDDQHHFLTLDGNVVFTHLDTQITSPHAEFYTDKQIGYFTKGARITQPGTTITADKVSAFYAERKAVLTGRVQVVTEKVKAINAGGPKPSTTPQQIAAGKAPPASNLPTIMLCNELVYWWETQVGDAIGDVKIRQGDKRGFCDRAHYIGQETRTVHMFSNVRYERGPDDWMICEDAIIDMNTNVFTGNGNVEAYVKLQNSPSPAPALTTVQGDRVLKPRPPSLPDTYRAPDAVPSPSEVNPPSDSTVPAGPAEPQDDASPH